MATPITSIFSCEIIMNEVQSGNIAEVGWRYDPLEQFPEATGILEIKFKNGSRYRYKDVPSRVYETLRDHRSPGSYLAQEIKGKYETFRYESGPENKNI